MAHELLAQRVEAIAAATRAALARVLSDAPDAEAIHDLRVGMRRLRVMLRSARKLHGKKRVRALEERLKALGAATNELRDEEVLGETLGLLELEEKPAKALRAWLERRSIIEQYLRSRALRAVDGPATGELLDAICALCAGAPKKALPAEAFAHEQIGLAREAIRAMLPVTVGDVERLHRLRIRFKRLRYTAEMFSAAGGESPLHDAAGHALVARGAARFQKELGLVHDCDVAIEEVRAARDLSASAREATLAALQRVRDGIAGSVVEELSRAG